MAKFDSRIFVTLSTKTMTTLKSFVPAIVWWIISLVLFSLPGNNIPQSNWFETLQVDKWVHAGLFAVLVYLFYRPFLLEKVVNAGRQWVWIIPAAAIGYGILVEILQYSVIPNRSFDVWDIAADSAGALIARYYFGRQKQQPEAIH